MSGVLTQEDLDYMRAHGDDNYKPDIIICTSICGIFSILFVVLRLYSRYIAVGRLRLELSDWLLLVAWIFFLVIDVSLNIFTVYGGGRHILFVPNIRAVHIISVEMEVVYSFAIAFIKLSILALYGSIFPQRRFHYCLWAVVLFIGAWAIPSSFVTIFQCTPISFVWDRNQPGFCINYGASVLVFGILNIITDFVILAMPIPLVRQLQMSQSKKRILTTLFATGCSACIVSIIRLVFTLNVGEIDGTYTAVPAGFCSITEITMGIFAASIPTYRPLYIKFIHKTTSQSNDSSDYNSKTMGNSYMYAKGSQRNGQLSADRSINGPDATIRVTDQFELVRHVNRGGDWIRVEDEDDEVQLFTTRASNIQN